MGFDSLERDSKPGEKGRVINLAVKNPGLFMIGINLSESVQAENRFILCSTFEQ
jgi:hypothetical protein